MPDSGGESTDEGDASGPAGGGVDRSARTATADEPCRVDEPEETQAAAQEPETRQPAETEPEDEPEPAVLPKAAAAGVGLSRAWEAGAEAGAEEAGAWGPIAPGLAPTELLWRKWLLLAAIPVAGVIVGLSAWAIIASRSTPESPISMPVDVQPEPKPIPEEPPSEKEPPQAPRRFDARWLPGQTRLLVSVRLSQWAGREEFRWAMSAVDPGWQAVVGDVISAFGLHGSTIRRVSWASANLSARPDPGVVVIEFEEGHDAGIFRTAGEDVGIELAGEPCRRLTSGGWSHPFAVLDSRTMITGRKELLRELADRSEEGLQSVPMDRLLKVTTPEAPIVVLLDLAAAREAGWRLPTSLWDVWPPGRDAWHVLWEMPQGLGFWLHGDNTMATEIGLVCEGETAANTVGAAVDKLIPATKTAVRAQRESLRKKVQTGQIKVAAADPYDVLLDRAGTALQSTRWEVAEEIVWMRTDWGQDVHGLVSAALGSRPTVHAEWLAAARVLDAGNHRRLLSGLDAYQRAEGHFPEGAGGGGLLSPDTRLSWIAMMLPYYGRQEWYRELDFGYEWNNSTSSENAAVARRRLDEVVNPALGPGNTEAGFPVTHYVGVAGVGAGAGMLKPGDPRAGVFGFGRTMRMEDISDGASNTIAIMGVTKRLGPWASGGDATVRALTKPPYVNGPDGFGSGQPGGMLVGMADGSVRFVSKDIDPTVLEQLATAGGREQATAAALEPAQTRPSPSPRESRPKPDDVAGKPEPAPEGEPEVGAGEPEVGVIAEEPAVGPEAPLAKVDVQARLADPVLKIDFAGVSLVEALDLVAQISTVRISFDLEAMAQRGVGIRDPVAAQLTDATVEEVLEAIVSSQGLVYVVEDDRILITSPERKRDALGTVDYAVSDLTGPDARAVAELANSVQELVAPESWRRAGGRGTVELSGDILKVAQTDAVHHQILTFCEKLRSARGVPLGSTPNADEFTLATRLDAARARLGQTVTANFRDPAPLVRILSYLEELTETEIVIDWLAPGLEGMSPEVKGSLNVEDQPLTQALDALLGPLALAYRVVDADTLEITTRKEVGARLELEFYPVAELLSDATTGPALVERIKDQLAGTTWTDAGGSGVLRFDEPSRCLIVLQSQPVQFQLQGLLDQWATEKPRIE